MIHTAAAATGVSIIIQQSAIAFSILKYFGAAYLFYLAVLAVKDKKPSINLNSGNTEDKKQSFVRLMRKGFFMNVLNPKVSLFFIAFLPQFIVNSGTNVTLQMLLLGFIFMIQSTLLFSLLALLSGKLTSYLNSSRFWTITKWEKVGVLSLLGLTLALAKK